MGKSSRTRGKSFPTCGKCLQNSGKSFPHGRVCIPIPHLKFWTIQAIVDPGVSGPVHARLLIQRFFAQVLSMSPTDDDLESGVSERDDGELCCSADVCLMFFKNADCNSVGYLKGLPFPSDSL